MRDWVAVVAGALVGSLGCLLGIWLYENASWRDFLPQRITEPGLIFHVPRGQMLKPQSDGSFTIAPVVDGGSVSGPVFSATITTPGQTYWRWLGRDWFRR